MTSKSMHLPSNLLSWLNGADTPGASLSRLGELVIRLQQARVGLPKSGARRKYYGTPADQLEGTVSAINATLADYRKYPEVVFTEGRAEVVDTYKGPRPYGEFLAVEDAMKLAANGTIPRVIECRKCDLWFYVKRLPINESKLCVRCTRKAAAGTPEGKASRKKYNKKYQEERVRKAKL